MIFKWYKKDFAANLKDEEVLEWIVDNMEEGSEKREKVEGNDGKGGGGKINQIETFAL